MEQYEPKQDRSNQEQEELTRMVREGIRPDNFQDRMKLAGDKLAGNVPLGVDASNKTMRKVIGGGAELLAVVKFGFLGGIFTLLGLLFIYVGFYHEIQWKVVGLGVLMLAVGIWALRATGHAWRNFRAISKA
jgi:hypothetical protein